MMTRTPPKSAPPRPELLTVTEAAEYLSVSRKSVEVMIAHGTLLAVNVATLATSKRKAWRLRRQDLDQFLRNRQQKPVIVAA
jgi:excisionase family DNA binding protein